MPERSTGNPTRTRATTIELDGYSREKSTRVLGAWFKRVSGDAEVIKDVQATWEKKFRRRVLSSSPSSYPSIRDFTSLDMSAPLILGLW